MEYNISEKRSVLAKISQLDCNNKTIESANNILCEFPASFMVLEKHVPDNSFLDISIGMHREKGDLTNYLNTERSDFCNEDKGWEKIKSIIEMINNSPKYSLINEVWLEFDAERLKEKDNPPPGIGFQVYNMADKQEELINLISNFNPLIESSNIKDNLETALAKTKTGIKLSHIAYFLSRNNSKVRACFLINQANSGEFFKNIKVSSSLYSALLSLGQTLNPLLGVSLDISENGIELQGIELYPHDFYNWEPILSALVKNNLCDELSFNQALSWPSEAFNSNPSFQSNYGSVYSNTVTGINSIKLVNKENCSIKIYLFIDTYQ